MKMRPGGREIETLVTKTPGQLEFIPNLPAQHHRTLDGKDFVIAYGAQNRVDNFHANDVRTTTDPTAEEKQPQPRREHHHQPHHRGALRSRAPASMSTIQQSGDFAYQEGERKARAAKATMDGDQNVILLDTGARMSDATGATTADRIRLDRAHRRFHRRRQSQFHAACRTRTRRRTPKCSPATNPCRPRRARWIRATATAPSTTKAASTMWQGANRITADTVDIDREKRIAGRRWPRASPICGNRTKSESQSAEEEAAAPPVLTETRAAHMVYTEADRLTHYSGGVVLKRPGHAGESQGTARVPGRSRGRTRAWRRPSPMAMSRSFPQAKDRTRTGTGEHAEYYPDEQKVILRGRG